FNILFSFDICNVKNLIDIQMSTNNQFNLFILGSTSLMIQEKKDLNLFPSTRKNISANSTQQ
ncbi:MAG: hypothetical protein ACJA1B_002876, partial [Polaribacter sp.]